MEKELVIAVYDRDYTSWIKDINNDVKITPYRKGNAFPLLENKIKIEPHVGRDVHTFFWHIYNNYENLSELTYFVQDFVSKRKHSLIWLGWFRCRYYVV